jgi:hypothetical protein
VLDEGCPCPIVPVRDARDQGSKLVAGERGHWRMLSRPRDVHK